MAIVNNDKFSIGDLFNNRNPFVIPKHQRAYSWEGEEIATFCDDIVEVDREYFLGGIVSVFEYADNGPGRIYKIIDGQQRLTTFYMLLSLIKNSYQDLYDIYQQVQPRDDEERKTVEDGMNSVATLKANLYENFLTYQDTRQRPPVRKKRVTLSKVDKSFFDDFIDGNNPIPTAVSHKRIVEGYDILKRKLIQPIIEDPTLTVEGKEESLRSLEGKILDNCVIIHIVCETVEEAYELFEVLNDRGRNLATGDYLRSKTVEMLETYSNKQDDVISLWDNILGRADAEKFLKSYLTSHLSTVKKSHLHRQILRKFFSYQVQSTSDANRLKNRVTNMKDMFDVYSQLVKGEWPYNTNTVPNWWKNRLSLLINNLEHTLCVPFLMACYECTNESDFKECIFNIEKFVFRYILVSSMRANKLSRIYKKHIILLRENNFSLTRFKDDLKLLLFNDCSDATFTERLSEKFLYKSGNISKLQYFLTTIEYFNRWYKNPTRPSVPVPSTSFVYDVTSIDIEHIYPTSPQNGNVDYQLEEVKNNIGNLTIWHPDDNRSTQNANYSTKKTNYSRSSISITRELDQYPSWDINSYRQRNNIYCDMAVKIFAIY